ncbi:secreted RxLR effector protein 161-like [Solanum verrucosum]|uniref:secreted RxLR effector protein 161-like n=1 Tax=Solanum verrucosum TaxID=315347 RepID=UPI0020D10DB5|nr:secreted RxLR effector protein 161-like [Solanum verrucosum]
MTRPDLAFTAQVLSQFMHCPKESHMEAALRAVKYIKETPGLGLLMPAEQTTQLIAYCDSDWGACLETRKSVTGFLVKFEGGLISWKSKKHGTVSRSSAEAEFRSMATYAAKITWLIGLYKELGVNITVPVKMVCDSKAAIQIAANPIFHERTKHIDIDCHFVRERICQGILETEYINTKHQLADLRIKSLGQGQHHLLLSNLGMKNIFQP